MDRQPQEVNASWLTPEVLIEFIDELRDAGYKIGVSQYIAVQDLILALIAQGENLDRPQRFKSILSPLLCHSPTEQEDFYRRFDQWLQRMGFIISQAGQRDTKAEELQQELHKIKKQWRTWQQWWSLVVILFLTVIAWVILSLVSFQPRPSTKPPNPNIQPLNPSLNWQSILGVLLLIAFLTFLAWGIWWFWRADQFLVRHATNQQPQLEQVSIPGLDEELFPNVLFLRIAQGLRRRIRVPSAELDINGTLKKSMQRGGLFTPVYVYRQVLPEYLVLIDRTNYGDHQARIVEEMIDRLKLNEVFITVYYFDGDPRVCFPMTGKGTPCTLNEIAAKYNEYRLIIFSVAEGLFSSRTGKLEPWSNLFLRWSDRAVLTPKPSEHWGYQELELSQQFIIQPSTPEGLMELIRSIQSGESSYEPSENIREPFPEELRVRSRRWIQRDPPESLVIDEVLKSLRRYLGKAGYDWLSACAVFPELHWNLTLYLGNTLQSEDGRTLLQACHLNDLTRLPWFRQGYIPDWLRKRLICEIPRPQEKNIRSAIEALLITAVQGHVGGMQLEIARNNPNVLSKLALPLLRLLVKRASEDSLLHDYIFLDFMAGSEQKRLAVRLPEALYDLLHSQGVEWRLWLRWVLGTVLSSALSWDMKNKRSLNNSQKIKADKTNNSGQIGQAGRDLYQTQTNYIIRFFKLLSEQALKGSIVGVVIGLSVMFISPNILYPIFKDYTISAKYAEFISAIFVGLYCYLFCGNHISHKSHKIFLAALAAVVTWFVLPSVREVFLPKHQEVYQQINDTISYSISYAIICVLAGGVIEIIAEMSRKNQS